MSILLKILLFFIIFRYAFRFLLQYLTNKTRNSTQNQQTENEGTVIIHHEKKQDAHNDLKRKKGEYVDYEKVE